jgi:hypothetical protein
MTEGPARALFLMKAEGEKFYAASSVSRRSNLINH